MTQCFLHHIPRAAGPALTHLHDSIPAMGISLEPETVSGAVLGAGDIMIELVRSLPLRSSSSLARQGVRCLYLMFKKTKTKTHSLSS